MRLLELIGAVPAELAPEPWNSSTSSPDPIVRGIVYDSRSVAPGNLFVAIRGALSDGHDYLEQAVALGAAALLVEEPGSLSGSATDIPVIRVGDTRRTLSYIANRFYGDPARELALIGVTGTNGKTSTAYLVESILAAAHFAVGLMGTVEVRYATESAPAVNTTPESLDLQRTLRAMRNRKIEHVVMEVSSHGLELGRVQGCQFQVAAFTNLTQDHLDFHGTMKSYCESKLRLFDTYLVPGGAAVINVDDPAGPDFEAAAQERNARILSTTRDPVRPATVRLLEAECRLEGTRARVEIEGARLDLELPLIGDFNLENLLVACGTAHALGIGPEDIRTGVARCPQVPGRMERVGESTEPGPTVVVDYAHTPDAVEKLLSALGPMTSGRLITVFGCGGDRDRAKRPLMAEAVARHSDRVIATSDNPRTENSAAILRDVEAGLGALRREEDAPIDSGARSYTVIEDRRRAIEKAIAVARDEDTVVIAGKGHEDYQIIGHEKRPFDDRREATRILAETEERP